jgi:hypothetical protein
VSGPGRATLDQEGCEHPYRPESVRHLIH